MAEVRVRNLDDWVVNQMKARAKRNGHSLEAELRQMLTESVVNEKQKLIEKTRKFQKKMQKICGVLPDSTDFIRAMRDGDDK